MTGTRGRPRDPRRDQAILAAARKVMARRGYTGATVEEIAKTAGVGKDTVYRRWSGKDAIAVDLIDNMARDAVRPAQLELDPHYNLFVYLKDVVRLATTTDFGPLVAGVVGAAARDPQVARVFSGFWTRRRALSAALVRDITGDDVSEERIEFLLDQLFGPLYYRILLSGAPVGDEYLWDLVLLVPLADEAPSNPHGADLVGTTTPK